MKRYYLKLKHHSKKRYFWWIMMPSLVFVTAIYSLLFLNNPVIDKEDPEAAPTAMLIVPPDASIHSIADTLKKHGFLRSEITFRAAAKLLWAKHKIHGGTFEIHRGLSNFQMIQDIVGTKYQIIYQLGILEGFRLKDIANAASANLGIPVSDIISAAHDTALLHWLGLPREAQSAEGYLYPDNYKWIYPLTGRTLIQTLVRRFHQMVPDTLLEAASARGLSPHQVVTIASIAEGESKVEWERYLIAGVYENRYRIGMKLQADPTVQYGLGLDRAITHRDLFKPTPYNTYLKTGLPPGPINNPTLSAITAAVYPAETDYLFFVARRDGSRTHYFSSTYAGQLENIRKEEHNIASNVGGR